MLPTEPNHSVSTAEDLAGLVSLCAAYSDTIDCLRAALDEHREAVGDQRRIRQLLAHEMRTPLTSIIGTIETVLIADLPPDTVRSLLKVALRQATQLDETVEDILVMSNGRDPWSHRVELTRISLAEIVSDACRSMVTQVDPACLKVDVPDDLVLETVPSRMRQVLVNLLVNAVRYGPDGEAIELKAFRDGADVCIEISDRGPGVNAEDLPALFTPFVRGVSLFNAESDEGLGLGLYVVAGLVDSLGGAIDLVPREGGGTTARVVIPQRRDSDPVAP